MSNLWIYWRRPSCIVRYRHGGESALFPLLKQPTVESQRLARTAAINPAVAAETSAQRADNVLDFSSAQRRSERGPHNRAPRTKGKPTRRD